MSIAQKALQFALRPLLNERHRTGLAEGRVEGHAEGFTEGREEGREEGRAEMNQEWETRLRQWREAGTITWHDDPPPVKPSE